MSPDHPDAGSPATPSTTTFPVPSPGAAEDISSPWIGRYKIVEKLGEGGCGSVYRAEQQEPVRRQVALKVIKLGMDTRQVVARFEAERQALAMMDHPNIAKVFDAGTTDRGRPYFVMELVRGVRITDYCDQSQLGTEARVQLLVSVCQAVQHAHQKGIIHRDLKPSNILVALNDDPASAGVPKVIDFGIAKATEQPLTDKTLFTELNQFIGTPAYMSPEQAEMTGLDIDTRSDIYSLGVLLYELLTGCTPFDAGELAREGLDAIRRTIREVEPPRPSTRLSTLDAADLDTVARARGTGPVELRSRLRGELDWIVMKCLEKDRSRRYETANALAQDLRRHLANEPVSAGAPSAAYRFRKFVRRHRTALGVAAALAVILLGATVASTWEAIRATRAEALARQRVVEADKARQEAQAVSTFLTEVFQSPDPARDGRTITVEETLARAAKKLETDLTNQPARRAGLQETLGRTYHALGLDREAIVLLEKARDHHRAVLGPQAPETLTVLNSLANSYSDAGRRDEALRLREQVLEIRRKVSGPDDPETLTVMAGLAVSYDDAGRPVEAFRLREDVLARRRKVLGPQHPDTLRAMSGLANSHASAGRWTEALPLREEVLSLSRKVNGPAHPYTLSAMHNLAISYEDAGRRDEALQLREGVLAFSAKVNGPEHPDTLLAMNNLASSHANAGRRAEALRLREEVLSLRRKVLGPEHPDTIAAMSGVAGSYVNAGRRGEALKLREEVLVLRRKVQGPEHPDTLWAMESLASSHDNTARRGEALQLREEILGLRRKGFGPQHPDTLWAMSSLAHSYEAAGRRDDALRLREEVLSSRRKVLGPEHPHTIAAMGLVATSYEESGRREDALKLREEALALHRKVNGPEYADTLRAMVSLAGSYEAAGRRADALRLEKEVLEIRRKVSGPENPDLIPALRSLAISYGDTGRQDEALKLEEDILAVSRKVNGPEHPDTLSAMHNLAVTYSDTGRQSDALRLREEVFALRRRVLGLENPDTLLSLRNLAISYGDVGRMQDALKLEEEALVLSRKVNGPEHPDTISLMRNLAVSYGESGRSDEALKLEETVLALSRKVNGPEHPDTQMAMNNMAVSLHHSGRRDEALRLREELLALRRKVLGPDDPETISTLVKLTDSYAAAGRLAEADRMLGEALPASGQLAAKHGDLFQQRGTLRARTGRWKEAVADLTRAVELDPKDDEGHRLLSLLLVQTGDWEGFRKHRGQTLLQFADTQDPEVAEETALDALFLPVDGPDLEAAGRLADIAMTAVPTHVHFRWFQLAKGLSEYRQGRFAGAVAWEEKVMAKAGDHSGDEPHLEAHALAVLALGQQRLGHADEARAALGRATRLFEGRLAKREGDDLGENWDEGIITQALLGEARQMIEGK